MSMRDEGRAAVLGFVDADTQLNAALTGENKEYVMLTLQLIKDDYHEQVKKGKANFTLSPKVAATLNELRPW